MPFKGINFDKFIYLWYMIFMIPRHYDKLEKWLKKGTVLILYGPRQVGKTTLLTHFLSKTGLKYKLDTGDNIRTQELLSSKDLPRILEYVEGYELLAIDEAQQIPEIGLALKMIVDHRPDLFVIATGSSSFDLAHQIGEPLTGRKKTLILYPLAQSELLHQHNRSELKGKLEEFLILGSYPAVVSAKTHKEKTSVLRELADSYLLKDILSLERIKNSRTLLDLLKLLAFQVGQLVSMSELATQLGINFKTLARYLDLLEKTFVICRLSGFSRNLRKEVTSQHKYYFWDVGIRNAIVSQFNKLNTRNDVGALWENFVMIERTKARHYLEIPGTAYFWRSYSQQEIDLIEEREGKLFAYECGWGTTKSKKIPGEWKENYPHSKFEEITPKNYLDFLIPK